MTSVNNKKSFNRKTFLYNSTIPTKPMTLNSAMSLQKPTSTFEMLKQSMISGLGAGVGLSVADRLVSTVLGPRKVEVQTETKPQNNFVRSPDCEDICRIYREALVKNEYVSQSIKEAYEKCNPTGN
jgi:hypothetical protein